MTAKKVHTTDEEIDPEAAEKAFAEVGATLSAIAPEDLAAMGIDRKKAAVFAQKVARDASAPALHARLASLPKSEFDHAQVGRLRTAALALWHASIAAERAAATATAAQVPVAMVQEALTVKARMLKVAKHLLDDDPNEGPEIAAIIPGSGYEDLASDLTRLAALYKRKHAVVSSDPKFYVAGDANDAKKLAQKILESLGDGPNADASNAAGTEARALTHVVNVYDDVAATLRWLYRNDAASAAKYPSLYAVARAARGPKGAAAGDGASEAAATPVVATATSK